MTQKNKLFLLTDWLFDNSDSVPEELKDNDLKFRLVEFCYYHLPLLYYLNKTINYFENYSIEDWLKSFKKMFSFFNIKSKKQLCFLKYKPFERLEFKKIIQENYPDLDLSENDLNNLFYLYENNIISRSIFNTLKSNYIGKEKDNLDLNFFREVNKKEEVNSSIIFQTNQFLLEKIKTSIGCRNCPFFSNEKLLITGQTEDLNLDVLVISTRPILENVNVELYEILKSLFKKYSLSFVFSSLVLCQSNTTKKINDVVIRTCSSLTNYVFKNFNSKLTILIGSQPKTRFGFKETIFQLNGKLIDNFFFLVEPDPRRLNLLKSAIFNLHEQLKIIHQIKQETKKSIKPEFNDELLNHYTLFDIKVFGEKVIYCFLENKTGKKKFITQDVYFPVYIKYGNFDECRYIEEEFDYRVFLTHKEKRDLQAKLTKKMHDFIRGE